MPFQGNLSMDFYVEIILERWRNATFTDLSYLILAIVLGAWLITRTEK